MENISFFVEFKREKPFKAFGEHITKARREANLDAYKAILAIVMKLIGNSFYGGLYYTCFNILVNEGVCVPYFNHFTIKSRVLK